MVAWLQYQATFSYICLMRYLIFLLFIAAIGCKKKGNSYACNEMAQINYVIDTIKIDRQTDSIYYYNHIFSMPFVRRISYGTISDTFHYKDTSFTLYWISNSPKDSLFFLPNDTVALKISSRSCYRLQ